MPRRRVAGKRDVLPDPVYSNVLVTKFINGVMWDGKKSTAEKIFYDAMQKASERLGEEPMKIFKRAVDNVKPSVEVKSRRIGGATYQVPLEVSSDRRNTLAIRWLVAYARNRGENTMTDRLVGEIMDAASGRGNAVKKKEDTHRMADANKAFAHYRF
ncbi:MAG TPA: 30S ribosomal protein S7 [Pyrinomonadaceae bacterium]|jgi:small subunit ribosomal protein S7|nr:30S ribosomal protein S7 [Pyrinomonadaceae bacterium]